jgi:hypothetical protein
MARITRLNQSVTNAEEDPACEEEGFAVSGEAAAL